MAVSTIDNSGISASAGISTSKLGTGAVLQVVQASTTSTTTTTSNAFVDTSLSASITPLFSTSKILVNLTTIIYCTRGAFSAGGKMQLVRNSTNLITQSDSSVYMSATGASACEIIQQPTFQYLDSPATTSSTTYKIQFGVNSGTTGYFSWNGNPSYLTLTEIAG